MKADDLQAHGRTGPLTDLRVIEMGHVVAGPFAGSLLADFGAEVFKIEQVGRGDSLRDMGPKHGGVGTWWSVAGRNKSSIALDLRSPEGIQVILDLVGTSDGLIENFRPGVLEAMGLGWDVLHATNPGLSLLRISGYGQTGPYRERRGFGKIAEAFSGATNLTGNPQSPPVHPGYSLADVTSGLMGAFGLLMATRERDSSGEGQVVDLAIYEPLFRMIEWQVPLLATHGIRTKRNGASFPFSGGFVTDICETADGKYVVISAASRTMLERLASVLVEYGELDSQSVLDEVDGTERIGDAMRLWVKSLPLPEVLRVLDDSKLVAGPIYTAEDILSDPHIASRGNIVEVQDPGGVTLSMPGVSPTLSETPGAVRFPGQRLGAQSEEVLLNILGYSEERVSDLIARGVVGTASGE